MCISTVRVALQRVLCTLCGKISKKNLNQCNIRSTRKKRRFFISLYNVHGNPNKYKPIAFYRLQRNIQHGTVGIVESVCNGKSVKKHRSFTSYARKKNVFIPSISVLFNVRISFVKMNCLNRCRWREMEII